MRLLVVGAGAMGRWFAASVGDEGDELAFVDADPAAAEAAADEVGGRALSPPVETAFDLVCVAVPIPAAADVIAEYADSADGALCDVTGSMREPVAAMAEHAPDAERLSLHPLFAPENAPGNVAAVEDAGGPVTGTVQERLTARGNDVFETTTDEHDEAMETVQAGAHAAVLAFGLAADDVPEGFHTPVSEGLDGLVKQVAGGDGRVYADIQSTFEGADDVAAAARRIADADRETFLDLYEDLP